MIKEKRCIMLNFQMWKKMYLHDLDDMYLDTTENRKELQAIIKKQKK